jgi:hypothetical protein
VNLAGEMCRAARKRTSDVKSKLNNGNTNVPFSPTAFRNESKAVSNGFYSQSGEALLSNVLHLNEVKHNHLQILPPHSKQKLDNQKLASSESTIRSALRSNFNSWTTISSSRLASLAISKIVFAPLQKARIFILAFTRCLDDF